MSEYRFIGTLKECEHSSNNKVLRFVPDQECVVTENCDKDKVKYAVFLPPKDGEGIVFAYKDKVVFDVKSITGWLPKWKIDGRYALVLDQLFVKTEDLSKAAESDPDHDTKETTFVVVEVKGVSFNREFTLKSVTEKA